MFNAVLFSLGLFLGGVFNNLWSNQLHGKAFPLKESRGLGSMRSLRGRSKNTQQQKHNWRSLEPRKIPRGIQDIRGSGIRAGTGTQDLSPCQSQQVTSAALFLLNRKINKREEGQGVGKGSTAGCSCCSRARGSSSEALKSPKVGRDHLWRLHGSEQSWEAAGGNLDMHIPKNPRKQKISRSPSFSLFNIQRQGRVV